MMMVIAHQPVFDDLILRIAEYLPIEDVFNNRLVCKRFDAYMLSVMETRTDVVFIRQKLKELIMCAVNMFSIIPPTLITPVSDGLSKYFIGTRKYLFNIEDKGADSASILLLLKYIYKKAQKGLRFQADRTQYGFFK